MRNLILGALASVVGFGFATPAFAGDFVDQNQIGTWSQDYIDVLVELDVLVGYPDGTFRPNANLTREEFAVALVKGLTLIETSLHDVMLENDYFLYEELVAQQTQILAILAELDEDKAKEVVETNNFVAIGMAYTVDRDGDTAETSVEASAKIQIIELSDTFAISVRPWVNTNTEIGAEATLDVDVTDNLEFFGGIGAGYRFDGDAQGALTGFDDDVVPYGVVGVSYDISDDVVVIVDAKSPFNSEEGKEIVIQGKLGWKF